MKRYLLHLLFFIVTFSLGNVWIAKGQTLKVKNRSPLRFDGLYCEPLTVEGRNCLRFYKDGLVFSASLGNMVTDEKLINVAEWLTRDPEKKGKYISEGSYLIKGRRVTFTDTVIYDEAKSRREVTVDYKGVIRNFGRTLILDSYSHYNGNREKARRFVFIKIKPKLLFSKN